MQRGVRLLALCLDASGFCASVEPENDLDRVVVADSRTLLRRIKSDDPDLIVLCDGLPRIDAVALCASLKNGPALRRPGALIVLEREDTERTLAAFDAGADDCLWRPCDLRVVWAHVRAIAWRYAKSSSDNATTLKSGPLQLDTTGCILRVGGTSVPLTRTELAILSLLFARPGWIVRREMLLGRLRGATGESFSHALDSHISNLRRKLGRHGSRIVAVKGLGYRLDFA